MTEIGQRAFYSCDNLIKVTLDANIYGEEAFSHCNSLTDIQITNNVTEIGNMIFYFCDSLSEVVVPETVTKIGRYAFETGSSYKFVTLYGVPGSYVESYANNHNLNMNIFKPLT